MKNYGFFVKKNQHLEIEAFVDADWATNKETRRSVTGIVIMINGIPAAYYSKEQKSFLFQAVKENCLLFLKVSD